MRKRFSFRARHGRILPLGARRRRVRTETACSYHQQYFPGASKWTVAMTLRACCPSLGRSANGNVQFLGGGRAEGESANRGGPPRILHARRLLVHAVPMPETMSDFWVYENWTVHTATVHHGWCYSCNHGTGRFGQGSTRNGRWHGPYGSDTAARSAPLRANSMLRDCVLCMM